MIANILKTVATVAVSVYLSACAGVPPKPSSDAAPYAPTQCGGVKTDTVAFLTKACDSQLQSGAQPLACGSLREEIAKVITQAQQEPARIMAAQSGNGCRETVMEQISGDMDKAMQTLSRYQAAQLDELIPKQCARVDFRKLDALGKQCEEQLAEPGKMSTKTACANLSKELELMRPVLDKADVQNKRDPDACSNSVKMINGHVGKALRPAMEYNARKFDENPTW
ncbi:hypothetical protein K5D33_19305 [Pseudomonas cichorii]|nr:hypothetical protein [Pseudomonas cichorii]MBX8536853.1 hypothetical protein [Pseudomonas cichorii]MBX8557513.1 hypothetical protein [Pseudomonas cichorii]MBX8599675.1 hypothetical protein [Pseudomonas cichorii]